MDLPFNIFNSYQKDYAHPYAPVAHTARTLVRR